MHRLALLALVACSAPSAPKRIALGEPPTATAPPALLERKHVPYYDTQMFLFGHPMLDLVETGSVDDGQIRSIEYAQMYNGLPVIGGHVAVVVSHGAVILAQGTATPLRDIETAPAIDEAHAIGIVQDRVQRPHSGDRDEARLVIFDKHLAWEVTAWRGDVQAIVYVDAQTADILDAHDNTRYEYTGIARNHVDERTVGDKVVDLPASHLRLRTARGNTTLTDDDGAFKFQGEGKVFVTANLNGRYVQVNNLAGENATFIGVIRPETKYQLEWTENHSTPEERDVFRGTTTTNRFVSTVYPDLPWMTVSLLAKVNHNRTCNAFWNGSSINFFVAGNGCNNSGRIFDVVAHEWGHGFDQNAPGGAADGGLGEFIGDLISFVQTKSPLLAPNFFTNGRPVRDLDDPNFQCYDPEVRQVHAAGQLLGATMFDVMVDLEKAGVTGEQLKRLLLRPIAIAQTRAEWYQALLAVDDDNGNLLDGTPHECIIYDQFKAHSCKGHRWPGMPAEDPPQCRR